MTMCNMNEIENISNFAITILSSILVGGIIMLFIESQHYYKQITHIHIDRMRPFYSKLTKYLTFLMYVDKIIVYRNKENEYILELQKNIEKLLKTGSSSITSGCDVSIMSSDEIELVCKRINNIWYYYENNNVKENVSIDIQTLDTLRTNIMDSLNEYSNQYADKEINIDLLPEISGAFYKNVWLPVQNTTSNYEHLYRQLNSLHNLAKFNIMFTSISLLITLFLYKSLGLLPIYIIVTLNVLLLIWVIFKGDGVRKKIQNYI